jgi:TonB family protein
MEKKCAQPSGASPADENQNAGSDRFTALLGSSFEAKPLWAELYEDCRDALFPAKLPPLELTSTPVPMPDRMAARTNPWAIGTATIANGGILALLLFLGFTSPLKHPPGPFPAGAIHLKDFTLFAPAAAPAGGGGGGGANELADPTRGRLPRRDDMPITPPQIPILENPRLAVDPAIAVPLDIKLPDNPTLPNIGMPNSATVRLASSNGPGTSGIGTGRNDGVGDGDGAGDGPGSIRGAGTGVYRPGVGGVTNPVPLVSPEAEFSDEARRNKYQGVCMISIIVDAHGYPQNPRIVRSLGMGLDEKALEAVQRYRFKPALKDGKPVAAMITVEVNFRLY